MATSTVSKTELQVALVTLLPQPGVQSIDRNPFFKALNQLLFPPSFAPQENEIIAAWQTNPNAPQFLKFHAMVGDSYSCYLPDGSGEVVVPPGKIRALTNDERGLT